MRKDEEYAKNSIQAYLEKHLSFGVKIIEGEDPPDYYVLKNNRKIALEITTAESIYNDEDEKNKRKTSTESVAKYCDELNNEFKKIIPAGKSLMLALKVPIANFSKFKKQLKRILKNFLEESKMSNKSKSLNINGEIVEARWVTHVDDNRKALIGVIGVKNPIINIQEQTQLILEKITRGKEVKLKKINGKIWNGEKWLGVINNYPLAEHENFSQALREVNNNYGFSKIFMIGDNSEVFEIQKATN